MDALSVRDFWNSWTLFLNAGLSLIAKRLVNAELPDMGKIAINALGKPLYLKYELSIATELYPFSFNMVYLACVSWLVYCTLGLAIERALAGIFVRLAVGSI